MKLTFFSTAFLVIFLIFAGIMIDRQFLQPKTEVIELNPPETGHIEKELTPIVNDSTISVDETSLITNESNIIPETESAVKTLYGVVKADSNIVGTKVKIDDLHIDIKVDKLKNTIYVDWIKYYETIRDRPKKSIIGEIILMIDEKKYLSIGGSIGFPKIVNHIMIHAEIQQKEKGISFSVELGYLFY